MKKSAIVATYKIGPVPVETIWGLKFCCPDVVEFRKPTIWDRLHRKIQYIKRKWR